MRRRQFHRNALTTLALGGSAMAWAQAKPPADGADYISLDQPAPTEGGPGKVDVVEFFWYSCPHCNSFEPQLEAWLSKLPDLHKKVFHAIHVEKQTLDTAELLAAWAAKQGLDRAKFLEQYNSFPVVTKVRRATQLQEQYKVDGVPSLGIAGRYFTSGSMAGNMQKALQVTDYLIAQAAKRTKA